ncbi:MAG TPA: hypothetical protein VIZ21_10120, partial [Ignavibacteriaceae bacterium]
MKFNKLLQNWILIIVVIIFTNVLVAQKPSENKSLQIIPDTYEESFIKNNMRLNKLTGVPL